MFKKIAPSQGDEPPAGSINIGTVMRDLKGRQVADADFMENQPPDRNA